MGADQGRRRHRSSAARRRRRRSGADRPDAGTAPRTPDRDRHRLGGRPRPPTGRRPVQGQPGSSRAAPADPRVQLGSAERRACDGGRMTTLPDEMIDRWQHRVDQAPGEGRVYWHMLVGEHPEVVALAQEAQRRLAQFSGLHMTPLKWLHMTALIAGPADEITGQQMEQMADVASQQLSQIPPITVTLGKFIYHPQAIMLAANPADALIPVREAARSATHEVTGIYGRPGSQSPWTPHITLCYSTSQQPAEPIISALGHGLPGCEIEISAISLVIQRG